MSAFVKRDSKLSTGSRQSLKAPNAGCSTTGVSQPMDDRSMDADSTRIMVVDDDPRILKLVAQMVVRLGYRSTAVGDALDALYHLNQTFHDLVITDYDMPFMNGIQLADQIKRRHCMTKVIIMSGQCEAVIQERISGLTNVDGLLFKPFNLNIMREKIEEVSAVHVKGWIP